jgi:prevent-host-death family protein
MGAYSIAEAKAHLSAIIESVERGEEAIITKRGKPVARITAEAKAQRTIDWQQLDAFRGRLRTTKASVGSLRKKNRY